jgi:antitoxin Phd
MIRMTSVAAQNQFGRLLDIAQQEAVAITRHGRATAFVVSPREMEELLDARRRRGAAVAELEAWSLAGEAARAGSRASKAAAKLTDDEVNRLVHEAR